ncbi:uncharacterized protein LOC124287077 [Haliotis rubra]|uniref:uncharacterized protein LOC124287077 n=1 Tax=Haliotis rubra TaxID=36100 RepID=UPI001EE5FFE7|nr:uncharacterized protein LOC124287077 [Haliotis rubra]
MKAQCVALLFVMGVAFVTAGGVEMTTDPAPPSPPFGGILEDLSAPVTVRDLLALGCIRALQEQELLGEVFRERNPTPTKRGQELAILLGRVLSRDRWEPESQQMSSESVDDGHGTDTQDTASIKPYSFHQALQLPSSPTASIKPYSFHQAQC